MSAPPSFERIDYALRTNKHIERKLVFDVLHAAAQIFPLENSWYLGLGSMWFSDFRIAHKILGINNMISIEHADYAARAEFNKPYSGIEVKAGSTANVIPALSPASWSEPVVAWLDYDKELNADVVSDLHFVLNKAAPNSVLIVTLNGSRGTYRVRKPGGALTREETSVGVVESFIGSTSTPVRFSPAVNAAGIAQDIREAEFPEFLAEALLTHLEHHVTHAAREINGERLTFVPLYSIAHKDGADMVTVGGALCPASKAESWNSCVRKHQILSDASGQVKFSRLDLVPVTLKEKITLDGCLPFPQNDEDFLASAKRLGVGLPDDEVKKYRRYYRHFPVFVETSA